MITSAKRRGWISGVWLAAGAIILGCRTLTAQQQWVELPVPSGLYVEPGGNVVVAHDFIAGVLNEGLSSYAPPGGLRVGHIDFPSSRVLAGTRLVQDSQTGVVYEIVGNGDLNAFFPALGTFLSLGNIRAAGFDASAVYDVSSGTVDAFGGLIIPGSSTFGDIGLYHEGTRVDLYVTGLSVGFPFVLRIRFEAGVWQSNTVLAASRANTSPVFNHPRGLTVRPDGIVVTTLPVGTPAETTVDRVFIFGKDYNPTVSPAPRTLGEAGYLFSRGMDSDELGQVYVATASVGTILGSGSVVVLNPALDDLVVVSAGEELIQNSIEVAVSPDLAWLYVSQPRTIGVSSWSGVARVNILDQEGPALAEAEFVSREFSASGGEVRWSVVAVDFRGIKAVVALLSAPGQSPIPVSMTRVFGSSSQGIWEGGFQAPPNSSAAPLTYALAVGAADIFDNVNFSAPVTFEVKSAPSVTLIRRDGSSVTLGWTGGRGPFQVFRRDRLTEGAWVAVGASTMERMVVLADEGGREACYRIGED